MRKSFCFLICIVSLLFCVNVIAESVVPAAKETITSLGSDDPLVQNATPQDASEYYGTWVSTAYFDDNPNERKDLFDDFGIINIYTLFPNGIVRFDNIIFMDGYNTTSSSGWSTWSATNDMVTIHSAYDGKEYSVRYQLIEDELIPVPESRSDIMNTILARAK